VISGDRARKKPGTPMLNVPIRVNWRGSRGNGLAMTPMISVSRTA
jgi:hypothetical protein